MLNMQKYVLIWEHKNLKSIFSFELPNYCNKSEKQSAKAARDQLLAGFLDRLHQNASVWIDLQGEQALVFEVHENLVGDQHQHIVRPVDVNLEIRIVVQVRIAAVHVARRWCIELPHAAAGETGNFVKFLNQLLCGRRVQVHRMESVGLEAHVDRQPRRDGPENHVDWNSMQS